MQRDAIDFESQPIGYLFRQMLVPTLVGMVGIVVLNISDGAFIGHGVGADGLAAVNIAAPLYNIISGMGLMFGAGCSVVASIHFSRNNAKAANINVTQCIIISTIVAIVLGIVVYSNLDATCRLFGSNDELLPMAKSYLKWIALSAPFYMFLMVGEFLIRLDGSPKFAMMVSLISAGLNIFLDWLFIFPFKMGLEGAAKATAISFVVTALFSLFYLLFLKKQIRLYRLKLTWKSLKLCMRNIGYQIKMGISSFLGEVAISCILIVGNFMFIRYLGEAGVAAWGVACYCLPIAFMMGNAIAQSAQPIISFAYGAEKWTRMVAARSKAFRTGAFAGILVVALLLLCSKPITGVFMARSEAAFDICAQGLPLFSFCFFFLIMNLVFSGYFQSVEKPRKAIIYTIFRGFLFLIPTFILLPEILGTKGLWLAMPISELLTTVIILVSNLPGRSVKHKC